MRFVSSDSTVSGSASPSAGETASSRMKSALPAARSVSAASSASESGVSPAAASASARASSAVSGSSSSTRRRPARAAAPTAVASRRRATAAARAAASFASTSCDASSSQCVSSTRIAVGIRSSRIRNWSSDVVQAVAPEGRVDLVDLRRRGDLGVERKREQRQPDARGPASRPLTNAVSFAPAASGGVVRQDPDERPQQRPEAARTASTPSTARSAPEAPGSRARA